MPEYSEDEDLSIVGFQELPVVKAISSEQFASGYCNKCRKRYIGAPVVNGSVLCPNCTK